MNIKFYNQHKQEEETTSLKIASLDPAKKPKEIDFRSADDKDKDVVKGIYELDGDDLKLCLAFKTERPTKFAAQKGQGPFVFTS